MLFEELNYDTSRVTAALGDCCYNRKDYSMATSYYKTSYRQFMKKLSKYYEYNHIV